MYYKINNKSTHSPATRYWQSFMNHWSHNQFEKTHQSLINCLNSLESKGGLNEVIESANDHEKEYATSLIKLCQRISTEYGHELKAVLENDLEEVLS